MGHCCFSTKQKNKLAICCTVEHAGLLGACTSAQMPSALPWWLSSAALWQKDAVGPSQVQACTSATYPAPAEMQWAAHTPTR